MKKNLLIIILLLPFYVTTSLACSNRTYQNFPEDCDLAYRYQALKSEFSDRFGVNIENLTRYRALRFISASFWDRNKEKINYLPWMAYGRKNTKKKIIKPDPKVWMFWERGDYYFKRYWKNSIRNFYISVEDIRRLHENIVDVSIMSKFSVVRKGARPGKLRSRLWQKAPGWNSKCNKWPMKKKDLDVLLNYDIKNINGGPLVRVKKYKECKKLPGFYKSSIAYTPSMQVATELQRLVNFINSTWESLADGSSKRLSPLDFIADLQRWFVSIHPFGDGNGRASRILQDAVASSFGLPYPPSGYLTNDIIITKNNYRLDMKQKVNKMIEELEYCLGEYEKSEENSLYKKDKDCSEVYASKGNESRKYAKRAFKNYLNRFLSIDRVNLDDFFNENPMPKVD